MVWIRHLDIRMRESAVDDFLICSLSTLLPNLVSFVHSARGKDFDPKALLSTTPHRNLRVLCFTTGLITVPQFRSVLVTFPGLDDLSWGGCYIVEAEYRHWDPIVDCWGHLETMEHTPLQKISIPWVCEILEDLDRARVLLPNVKVVTIELENEVSLEMCREVMDIFPVLERFEGVQCMRWKKTSSEETTVRSTTAAAASFMAEIECEKEEEKDVEVYPLTILIFPDGDHFNVDRLIAWLPCVVKLELGRIGVKVLDAMTRTCGRNLVYTRFSLEEQCSVEMCRFFAMCSRLKECLGEGHFVLAEDIINGPEFIPEEEEEEIPDDETPMQEQQQASHLIQRQVHTKLARLRNLSEISFGPRYAVDPMLLLSGTATLSSMASQREIVRRGLDFLQEFAFGLLLESLPYLRKVELSKFVFPETAAYEELEWMDERKWWVIQEKCENQVLTVVAHRLL
ncbi:hypothetical protein BG015_009322 [Linnemannia schmuckeri]|uniref:Uncharacterized protein n=1 Tax=Linnemannia schmuckeri TaxID=64567 RepID=A0A9P5VA10_9FUNG|nr:hypothetical protein BG015_009322 [Linnemannia schmuckeri]